MRDPKDVLCSAYHHCVKAAAAFDYQGTFQEFVGHFLNGHVESGDYWDFNRGYLENKDGFNILYITYEDLSRDKITCIKKISEFLGYKSISIEQIESVDKPTRFESMVGTQRPISGDNVKGKVGQNKEMLSESQRLELIKQTKSKFDGLGDDIVVPSCYFSESI